jgi:hypothetical protein
MSVYFRWRPKYKAVCGGCLLGLRQFTILSKLYLHYAQNRNLDVQEIVKDYSNPLLAEFYAGSQNCGKRLLPCSCLPVRVQQFGSHWTDFHVPYFPAHKTHHDFLLEILEKNHECILILVIYWKKTGLLHILLHESKPFTSSDARSHDLEANFTISR